MQNNETHFHLTFTLKKFDEKNSKWKSYTNDLTQNKEKCLNNNFLAMKTDTCITD